MYLQIRILKNIFGFDYVKFWLGQSNVRGSKLVWLWLYARIAKDWPCTFHAGSYISNFLVFCVIYFDVPRCCIHKLKTKQTFWLVRFTTMTGTGNFQFSYFAPHPCFVHYNLEWPVHHNLLKATFSLRARRPGSVEEVRVSGSVL